MCHYRAIEKVKKYLMTQENSSRFRTQEQSNERKGHILRGPMLRTEPTPEMVLLDRVTKEFFAAGIFNYRGQICQYFLNNAIGAGLVYELFEQLKSGDFSGLNGDRIMPEGFWNAFKNHGFSREEVDAALPALYKHALMRVDGVRIVRFNKDQQPGAPRYLPIEINGSPLILDDIVVRQGFAEPFAMVVDGPYAGLLLSLASDASQNWSGNNPAQIKELCLERILNDVELGTPGWRSNNYQAKVAGVDIASVQASDQFQDKGREMEIVLALQDIIANLPALIAAKYQRFLEQAGGNLNGVSNVQALFTRLGFPFNADKVNYLLPEDL